MKNSVYRSRQSLNSPSPGETEMDLLVTRERPRRGIRNSGYDVSVWWIGVDRSFPETFQDAQQGCLCSGGGGWGVSGRGDGVVCFPLLQSKFCNTLECLCFLHCAILQCITCNSREIVNGLDPFPLTSRNMLRTIAMH
jgi:hypothetical protein